MRLRSPKLLVLSLLLCGCATTPYATTTVRSSQYFIDRANISYTCTTNTISQGDRYPLVLDATSMEQIKGLPGLSDNGSASIAALRARFHESGEYPVIRIAARITRLNKQRVDQANTTYPRRLDTDANVRLSAFITSADGSGDILAEFTISSDCSSKYEYAIPQWSPEADNHAINETYHRGFVAAANTLLRELEEKRSDYDF